MVFEKNWIPECGKNHGFILEHCRDAPEATGDEPEDADFDAPKIYEPVSVNWFREIPFRVDIQTSKIMPNLISIIIS